MQRTKSLQNSWEKLKKSNRLATVKRQKIFFLDKVWSFFPSCRNWPIWLYCHIMAHLLCHLGLCIYVWFFLVCILPLNSDLHLSPKIEQLIINVIVVVSSGGNNQSLPGTPYFMFMGRTRNFNLIGGDFRNKFAQCLNRQNCTTPPVWMKFG